MTSTTALFYRLKKTAVRLKHCYTPDLRALGIMRIGIALVVLTDLCIRLGDLGAHYTNEGMWPVRLIRHLGWKPGYWSLHALNGSYQFTLSLFIIHFALALTLLVGYKTRFTTLLLWLMTISLHNRNLYVQQSGDDLLRLVLFWGIFLPWGCRYSIDPDLANRRYPWLAYPGYLVTIASVYLFSALMKTSPEWWKEGTAVYYALSLEQIRLPAGGYIYHFPLLLKAITRLVLFLEIIIPVLILWPSRSGTNRGIAFCLLLILHAGIGLTIYVGLFYVIGIVSAAALLPSSFVDRIKIFSKGGQSALPQSRPFVNSLLLIVGITSTIVNLSSLPYFNYGLRKELSVAVNCLRFDQNWGMFSPGVLKNDGWFVYHGSDSIGCQWDLRLNQDYVDYHKPHRIVSMYKTDRWRKLAENMQNPYFTFLRPLYGNYILREWNKDHPEKKIELLYLYFMEKESLSGYRSSPVRKELYCICYDH
jgi:hypothetical protein